SPERIARNAPARSHAPWAETYRVSLHDAKSSGRIIWMRGISASWRERPRRGCAMAEKPYDRLDGVIWYDGKLVPWSDATMHVLSHGLHYGSCVFEGERAYGGEIFKCTEHSTRLKESGRVLDFEIPYSVAEIDAAKRLVLEKNGQKDAY